MKTQLYEKGIDSLLGEKLFVSVEDFRGLFPDIPMPTLYARIRALISEGRLSVVGRGKYATVRKPIFHIPVSPWMEEVNLLLIQECVGVQFCMVQRQSNLFIQASKSDLQALYKVLTNHYSRVVFGIDAKRFPGPLEEYIILEKLVSDGPTSIQGGLQVPTLEKELVDRVRMGDIPLKDLQKLAEVYPINRNRLLRYARRRGVEDEVNRLWESLNKERIHTVFQIQQYLERTQISRAWVFGSFAREEETPDSDLDLLVDYSSQGVPSLITILRYKLDLEKAIGREVDLVETGYLKPFAAQSANRDKYLIYERASQ